MVRVRLDRVRIALESERKISQEFQGRRTRGVERVYGVVDRNFATRNRWRFVVFVPSRWRKGSYVSVHPLVVPNRRDWVGLERRSLQFAPCTKHPYRRYCYAKLALADATNERTRIVLSSGDPRPPWLDAFKIVEKEKVAASRADDGRTLVAVLDKGDWNAMIRLFLGLKPWAIATGFASKVAA